MLKNRSNLFQIKIDKYECKSIQQFPCMYLITSNSLKTHKSMSDRNGNKIYVLSYDK